MVATAKKRLERKAVEEGYKGRGRQGATTFYGSRVGIIGGGVQPADIGRQKIKRQAEGETENV